jgi:hypothetical protein
MQRQPLFLFLVALLCLTAAFVFRKLIYEIVVVPLAYVWWLLMLYYHLLPQAVIWIALIFIILFTAVRGLLMEIPVARPAPSKRKTPQGPIESLAAQIHKSHDGIYYKWNIANRLGRAARELLDQREGRKQKFTQLVGRGWDPPQDISAYLESGVNGTFADHAKKKGRTPLDLDPQEAIVYLESELEKNRNGNR